MCSMVHQQWGVWYYCCPCCDASHFRHFDNSFVLSRELSRWTISFCYMWKSEFKLRMSMWYIVMVWFCFCFLCWTFRRNRQLRMVTYQTRELLPWSRHQMLPSLVLIHQPQSSQSLRSRDCLLWLMPVLSFFSSAFSVHTRLYQVSRPNSHDPYVQCRAVASDSNDGKEAY